MPYVYIISYGDFPFACIIFLGLRVPPRRHPIYYMLFLFIAFYVHLFRSHVLFIIQYIYLCIGNDIHNVFLCLICIWHTELKNVPIHRWKSQDQQVTTKASKETPMSVIILFLQSYYLQPLDSVGICCASNCTIFINVNLKTRSSAVQVFD